MRKILWIVLLFLGLILANIPASVAQETENDKFSFGKVVSIADNQITVKEYDFAKDADVEVAYIVTPETEFGNINAVKDLVAGDDIVLDYVEKDGKRTVTTLVKEEKGAEAPMAPAAEGDTSMQAPAKAEAPAPAAPAEVAPAAPTEATAPATEPAKEAAPAAASAEQPVQPK